MPPAKLHSIGGGHWIGFIPGVKDSDPYLFYIEGRGSSGYKRGPRARLHRFRERSGELERLADSEPQKRGGAIL